MLKALGADLPIYAHIPMILGSDGKRLSKRHGAVSVQQYREDGILPEALLNYLVRLGWSHGDQEIFTREEMVQYFDINHINKAPAAFNPEKLLWLNQHYLKTGDPDLLTKHFQWQLMQLNIDPSEGPTLKEVFTVQRERVKTLKEMAEKSRFFYQALGAIPAELWEKYVTQDVVEPLRVLQQAFKNISHWEASMIHEVLEETAKQFGVKMGKLAQPLRVVVTGGTVSPPIDVTLQLLGKQRTVARLEKLQNQKRVATL
jgi:glutamyl-tRNA synthetase